MLKFGSRIHSGILLLRKNLNKRGEEMKILKANRKRIPINKFLAVPIFQNETQQI